MTPCFDFQVKQKDFEIKPEEARRIWEFAKGNYLDKGVSFDDTIVQLSKETGAPTRFFAEAFAGPKMQRLRTAEIYRTEDLRKQAISSAKQYIQKGDTSAVGRAISAASELPRASLTALHGGVFPVTHGGGLLLNPYSWKAFARGFKVSWLSLSDHQYHLAKQELQSHPYYEYGRQSGLKINPEEGPQGILTGWLSSKEGWSKKAWLGLQRMRLELFKNYVESFPKETRTVEFGRELADIANKATGVTNIKMGPMGQAMFAPQLTASKVMRVLVDPVKTVDTFRRMSTGMGKTVTPGERAAAYIRLRNAAAFIGTTYAGLLLNQALLSAQGSNQKINFTDRTKSDWMRFKVGGYVLSSRGPEEIIRLLGHLIAIGSAGKHDLHGKEPQAEALDTVARFGQYKINPNWQVLGEALYGRDTFGRPLPPPVQGARKLIGLTPQMGTTKKPQYTTTEYLLARGPIFIGGGARDVYETMRERGMSAPDALTLFKGALLSVGEFVGFGAYKEKKH